MTRCHLKLQFPCNVINAQIVPNFIIIFLKNKIKKKRKKGTTPWRQLRVTESLSKPWENGLPLPKIVGGWIIPPLEGVLSHNPKASFLFLFNFFLQNRGNLDILSLKSTHVNHIHHFLSILIATSTDRPNRNKILVWGSPMSHIVVLECLSKWV